MDEDVVQAIHEAAQDAFGSVWDDVEDFLTGEDYAECELSSDSSDLRSGLGY